MCESWGTIYPPGEGGAKGLPIEETRLFPIGGRDAASVLWRPPGGETTGPVVPNDHKGQFNCGFLWEQRKTKGERGRLIQPLSMGAKACRLVDSEGAPNFAVNPHKIRGRETMHKPREPPLEGLWVTWATIGTGPGAPTFWGWGVASREARFPHKPCTKGASRAEERRSDDLAG